MLWAKPTQLRVNRVSIMGRTRFEVLSYGRSIRVRYIQEILLEHSMRVSSVRGYKTKIVVLVGRFQGSKHTEMNSMPGVYY